MRKGRCCAAIAMLAAESRERSLLVGLIPTLSVRRRQDATVGIAWGGARCVTDNECQLNLALSQLLLNPSEARLRTDFGTTDGNYARPPRLLPWGGRIFSVCWKIRWNKEQGSCTSPGVSHYLLTLLSLPSLSYITTYTLVPDAYHTASIRLYPLGTVLICCFGCSTAVHPCGENLALYTAAAESNR